MTDTPDARLTDALQASENLDESLNSLAEALRDEGMGQREMFVLFNRARDAADEEDHRARDAISDILDRISGWVLDRYKLFP